MNRNELIQAVATKTGEELKIAASKVAAFKPGATLKAAVNGSGK